MLGNVSPLISGNGLVPRNNGIWKKIGKVAAGVTVVAGLVAAGKYYFSDEQVSKRQFNRQAEEAKERTEWINENYYSWYYVPDSLAAVEAKEFLSQVDTVGLNEKINAMPGKIANAEFDVYHAEDVDSMVKNKKRLASLKDEAVSLAELNENVKDANFLIERYKIAEVCLNSLPLVAYINKDSHGNAVSYSAYDVGPYHSIQNMYSYRLLNIGE